MNLADTAESSIKVIVALVLFIAIVLVVVGLARALVGRLRPQLVITDFADSADFPTAATAGLSAQLRHRVRREMYGRGAPDASSLVATVGNDIDHGLVEFAQVRRSDLEALQSTMLAGPVHRLLRSSPDDLAQVASGMRAIAPEHADGLVGAIAAALPRQRGVVVEVTPLARVEIDRYQVGLTIDIRPIGGAPDASATIWSDVGTRLEEGQLPARQRGALYELLPPASRWIALRLVATTPPPWHGRELRPSRRRMRAREWTALSRILTGQLALYEMKGPRVRPAVALGYVDQALEDCDVAGRLLREHDYFRPVRLEAYVEEARGYRRLDLADTAASPELRAEHERLAAACFRRAADRFVEVHDLLAPKRTAVAATYRALQIRLAKARLLAGEGLAVLDDLPDPLEPAARDTQAYDDLYNEACLWSVVVRVARRADSSDVVAPDVGLEATRSCGSLLGQAAAKTGAKGAQLIEHAKRDADFHRTFTAEQLDELLASPPLAG